VLDFLDVKHDEELARIYSEEQKRLQTHTKKSLQELNSSIQLQKISILLSESRIIIPLSQNFDENAETWVLYLKELALKTTNPLIKTLPIYDNF